MRLYAIQVRASLHDGYGRYGSQGYWLEAQATSASQRADLWDRALDLLRELEAGSKKTGPPLHREGLPGPSSVVPVLGILVFLVEISTMEHVVSFVGVLWIFD